MLQAYAPTVNLTQQKSADIRRFFVKLAKALSLLEMQYLSKEVGDALPWSTYATA